MHQQAAGVAWWSSALTPSREGACSIPNPGTPFPTLGIGCFTPILGSGWQVLFDSQNVSIGSEKSDTLQKLVAGQPGPDPQKKKKKKKVHQHWSVLITKRYSNHPTFAVERSCRVGLSSNQKEIGAIHAREKEVLPIISRFLVCFFLLSKAFLTV